MPPSLIVTLHRGNATADKLPRMHAWFRELEGKGVTSARLHVLEVDEDGVGAAYASSTDENVVAFESFAALEGELTTLRLDLFQDMRNLLLGTDDNTTCVWTRATRTPAAVAGSRGSARPRTADARTRTASTSSSDTEGFERYLALYYTPQEHGGCKDCWFFLQCKGQCPGTSIHGDWRSRTEHCDLWKGLFRTLEEQMLDAGEVPLSASPERKAIEGAFLELWSQGQSTSIAGVKRWMADVPRTAARRSPSPAATATSHTATSRTATLSRRGQRAQVTDIQRLDFTLPTSPGSPG